MRNFVAVGNTLTITAAADIASGDGVLVGSLFGVAAGDIAEGTQGEINLTGIYDLPKLASQAWTVGELIYWDEGDSHCTTVAASHSLIGAAAAPVGGGAEETTGRVRLNGAAVN